MKKNKGCLKKALWLFLVLLLLFGGLCLIRYQAWFGNRPEEPYSVPQQIDRVILTPGEDFCHERTLSWRCDTLLQESYILLQEELQEDAPIRRIEVSSQALIYSRQGKAAYYSAQIDSLREGSSYEVTLITGAQQHHLRLNIPLKLKDETTLLYFGDEQAPTAETAKTFKQAIERDFEEGVIEELPDVIAMGGDQIDAPSDKYWQIWYEALPEWGDTMLPLIAATGNHEYLKKGFGRELDPRWIPQFSFPKNGPAGFLGRSYFIDFPLLRFIVIDTTGELMPWQMLRHRAWLREVVESSSKRWHILMMHHAVDCVRESRLNWASHFVLGPTIRDLKIDLVLQGHDHAYARKSDRNALGEMTTPLYIISSSSPKHYRNGFDRDWDRLGSGLTLYQKIFVNPDELILESYKISPDGEPSSLYDAVTINRDRHITVRGNLPEEEFLFDAFGQDAKGEKKRANYQKEVKLRKGLAL